MDAGRPARPPRADSLVTRGRLLQLVYDDCVIGPGFVGGALCRQLAERGRDVVAVSRSGTAPAAPEGTGGSVDGVARDVTDGALALPTAGTVYYLVSAGGRSEAAYREAYVEGLRHVVAAAGLGTDGGGAGDGGPSAEDGGPALVYASSTGVYGVHDGSWVDEETPAEPSSATGAALVEAEGVARDAGGTVVRLSGLYGPGRTGVERYLGDVTVKRGYTNRIHRDDAARAMRAASDADGTLFLAVDDEPVDRHDLARWLSDQTGRPHGALVDELARTHKRCRNDRLRATGWAPEYPTYREGYRAILDGGDDGDGAR